MYHIHILLYLRCALLCGFVCSPVALAAAVEDDPDFALLHKDNVDYCFARGVASSSALTWVGPIRSYHDESYSTLIGQKDVPWNCAYNQNNCSHWNNGNHSYWTVVSSQNQNSPYVLDYRWESLRTFKTNSTITNVYQLDPTSWSIRMSIRVYSNVHIFLCDKEIWDTGNCYYIILDGWVETSPLCVIRKCSPHEINVDMNRSPTGNCKISRSVFKRRLVSEDDWLHFKLTWSKEIKELNVIVDEDITILTFIDSKAIPISNMLVRTREDGLLRLHDYNYLYTDKNNQYLQSPQIAPSFGKICISLQYFMSGDAYLDISASNGVTFEKYSLQNDNKWHEVYIMSKNVTTEFYMTITSRIKERNAHLGIGTIRECRPEGELRILKIRSGRKGKCQLLQFKGVSLSSNAKIKPNTGGCENGNFMHGCQENCSTLLGFKDCDGVTICTTREGEQSCYCGPGYEGYECEKSCEYSRYGVNCEKTCGHCLHTCNNVNGICEGGCVSGYRPVFCKDKYPILKDPPTLVGKGVHQITISINNLQYDGVGDISYISIEYRVKNDSEWKREPTQLKPDVPIVYTISHLKSSTTYEIRAVIFEKTNEAYRENDIRTIEETTSCLDPEDYEIKPGSTYVVIEFKMKKEDYCSIERYTLEVYDVGNPITKMTGNLPTLRNLVPFTNYSLTIFRETNYTFKTVFQTKEEAPSHIVNLMTVSEGPTTISLEWREPQQPNGIIRNYTINYKHTAYRSCQNKAIRDPKSSGSVVIKDLSVELRELLPYSEYEIEAYATTIEKGPSVFLKSYTDGEDEPSTRPIYTNLISYTNSARVYWNTSKDCTEVRGSINGFRLILSGAAQWNIDYSEELSTTSNEITLRNLIPFSDYKLEIYIEGPKKVINSKLPLIVNFTTSPSGPPSVQNLTAYSHGNNWISLRWRAPYPPYGQLQYYVINWKSSRSRKDTENVPIGSSCHLWPEYTCSTIRDLQSYIQYIITVKGVNENNLQGDEISISAVTEEQAASKPEHLKAVPNSAHEILLTWEHPWMPKGNVRLFEVEAAINSSELLDLSMHSGMKIKKEYKVKTESNNYSLILSDLLPSTTYVMTVLGKSSVQGDLSSTSVITQTSEPIFTPNASVEENGISNTTIRIKLPPAPRFLTKKSASFIVVTLLEGEMGGLEERNSLKDATLTHILLKEVPIRNGLFSWIAAEIQLGKTAATFVVGQQKQDEAITLTNNFGVKYENRPLEPQCSYEVAVVAVNYKSSGPLWSSIVLTQPVRTTGVPFRTSNNLGLLALLLLLLIPVLAYFIYIRYYKKNKPADSDGIPLHPPPEKSTGYITPPFKSSDLGVKVNYKPPIPTPRIEYNESQDADAEADIGIEITPTKPLSQRLSHKVPLNKLEQYVRTGLASGELQRQHALFPRGATQSCEYGRLPENKPKNRYGNMTAYDATRVVLKKYGDDEFSDYINANYIEGYKCSKFYIASQGPKPNTVTDFWRMIYQEQVQIISMLTNIVENGKKKCEQYWPELGLEATYGNISVLTTSSEIFADYTSRRLALTYKGKKRTVHHLHFTSWPDHGVPQYPQSVATYLKKMLEYPKGPGPILVHCSAGVGRTGTIILTHINLMMAAGEGSVDVLHYQQIIREQRPNMVDNADQYKLVHLVLVECLVEEPTNIKCDGGFRTHVQELKANGGLQKQFERLRRLNSLNTTSEEENNASQIPQNEHKNRNQDIVPGSTGNVILVQISADDPTSTYINAVFVDGFRSKNLFIATQFPLEATVGDFWRLVLEKNITLIVVLNEVDLRDKGIVEFLPKKDSPLHPLPNVDVRQSQIYEYDHWCLQFLQLRETSLESLARKEVVRLLQYKGWNNSDHLPPTTDSILKLWNETERVYTGKGPILVTCLDGAKACGLFIAMSFLVEKVKLEQTCDVCQAVRTICRSREQFISAQEQFEFLYDCVGTYIESFQTYANFQ